MNRSQDRGFVGSGEETDWAQRRNPRACKLCRKKKVRCDGGQPTCAQCLAHKSTCTYLPRANRVRQRNQSQKNQQGLGEGSRNDDARSTASSLETNQNQPAEPLLALQPNLESASSITVNVQNDSSVTAAHVPQTAITTSAYPHALPSPSNMADDLTRHLSAVDPIFSNQTPLNYRDFGDGGEMDLDEILANLHGHPELLSPNLLDTGPTEGRTKYGISGMFSPQQHQHPTRILDNNLQSQLTPEVSPNAEFAVLHPSQPQSVHTDAAHGDSRIRPAYDGFGEDEDIGHSLQITSSGHHKYMGPSISFIPGTQLGQQWITNVTGSTYFSDQLHAFLVRWTPDSLEGIAHTSQAYNAKHLPSLGVALVYVDAYFQAVQCTFPILERSEFMEKFNRTYEHLSPNLEPIWCAKVNLVLAIGCRAIPGSNEDQICGLFENALGYLSAIILGCSNIQKVQTLTLMYLFLSHTTSPHWGYTILACAVRESQALALHLQPFKAWGVSQQDLKKRKLLFWTLYCLDVHLSFRIGRPPSMRQSDITLSYPDQEQRYDGGLNDGQLDTDCDLDIFIQMQLLEKNIMAAQIMHRVYELTISRLEINILEQRVIELEKEIDELYTSVNSQWVIRPGGDIRKFILSLSPMIVCPVVLLNTSLCNARWVLRLRTIAMKIPQMISGNSIAEAGDCTQSIDQDFESACRDASTLIDMISSLPTSHISFYWYFEPLPVFALYVLFLGILRQPESPTSIQRMESISIVIESTVQSVNMPRPLITDPHLTHFLTFFARAARMAIQRAKNMPNSA